MTGKRFQEQETRPTNNPQVTDSLTIHLDANNYTSGTTWDDLTANNYDFILQNGMETGYNADGWFDLDGVDDYSTLNWTNVPTSDYTYEFWIQTQNEGGFFHVGGGPLSDDSGSYDRNMGVRSDGTVYYRIYDGSSAGTTVYSSTSVDDGVWHLVTVTTGSTNGQRIFINGSLESTFSGTTSSSFGFEDGIVLGSDTTQLSTSQVSNKPQVHFPGLIATYRLHSRELSASEVDQNYQAEKS